MHLFRNARLEQQTPSIHVFFHRHSFIHLRIWSSMVLALYLLKIVQSSLLRTLY
jgi:hypothetical protein